MSARQLLDEARRLSLEERIALAGDIWASIGESNLPISEAQRVELRRRIAYYHDHPQERGVTLGDIKTKLGVHT
ncbi:MAG: addiction module protein [Burkholderiales bacterium]